jgi:polyhydroxybutyrate depolymerase
MKIHISSILIIFFSLIFLNTYSLVTSDFKEFHLNFGGIERTYLVHFPTTKTKSHDLPVVFCLHGSGGTAKGMIRLTRGRFNDLADQDGFIVVYPDAVRKNWNDGRSGYYSYSVARNIDDVGFILQIIKALKADHPVDDSRIFVCGMSNGGFMTMRLACEQAGVFKGAAAIVATISEDFLQQCKPVNPINILFMNGTSDPLVPYQGGEIGLFRKTRGKIISTDNAVKFWSGVNGCNPSPFKELLPDQDPSDSTRVEKYTFTDGKNGTSVMLFRVIGGGHTWPGGLQYLREGIIGRTCKDINACDEIWKFFKR